MHKTSTTSINSQEVNNNNMGHVTSPKGKLCGRNILRKQSATWKDRVVIVQLLNKRQLQISIQPKARYGQILEQICAQIGLTETNIFGIATKSDQGEFRFLDRSTKVCKRLFAQTNPSQGEDLSLYLRVQHYVEPAYSFRTEIDKLYYYHQLKDNFLRYGFNYPDDRCFLLASYAIHADQINLIDFDPREYFPMWVLKRYGIPYVRRHLPTILPDKMTPNQAMNVYLNELSTTGPYAYNVRFHRLQSSKAFDTNDTRLGISSTGLDVYEVDTEGYLNFFSGHSWNEISSVNATKRRLEINTGGSTLCFYTTTESWCALLAHSIRTAQANYIGENHKSVDSPTLSMDLLSFRESYIYSSEFDLEWEYEKAILGSIQSPTEKSSQIKLSTDAYTQPIETRNRFSIASSSTATSGIVSDRTCVSINNSQEDLLLYTPCGESCDSLLDTKDHHLLKSRAVTIQRAISEPTKSYELRRLQVRQPQCLQRRALSDETVDDHDYENVAVIRRVLDIQMAAKRRSQSNISQTGSETCTGVPEATSALHGKKLEFKQSPSGSRLSVQSASTNHRYSLISTSPSLEKLLIDYTPPPSYNEVHAKQRALLLAGKKPNCSFSTPYNTTSDASGPSHSASSSLSADSASYGGELQKNRPASMPHGSARANLQKLPPTIATCNCKKLSHPEIDKLRTEAKDLKLLPMISALCNDKELQRTANQCNCYQDAIPSSPRPISWHCETQKTFTFPALTGSLAQVSH